MAIYVSAVDVVGGDWYRGDVCGGICRERFVESQDLNTNLLGNAALLAQFGVELIRRKLTAYVEQR